MTPIRRGVLMLGTVLCLAITYQAVHGNAEAASAARAVPSGEGVELEYTGRDGAPIKTIFPIYQVGAIRYFSAGMGTDERSAQYPPYPLKLVFLAGPKAYIAQVAVTIKDAAGAVNVLVPADHVAGPWLFVDLPAGTYEITAIRQDRSEVAQRVEVQAGSTKVVHFRWKK